MKMEPAAVTRPRRAGVWSWLDDRLGISDCPTRFRATPGEVAAREREEHAEPFTSHLRHIGLWTPVLLGVVLLLSGLRPAVLGPEGVEGIEITKPPWYFLWLYPFENWFGLATLYVIPAVLAVGLLLLPFLERSGECDPRRRRVWIGLAALVFLAWLGLTIYGAVTVPISHTEMGA